MSNIEKDFIKKLNEKPDNKINVKIPEHLLRMGSIKNKFKVVITDKLKVYTKNNSKENIERIKEKYKKYMTCEQNTNR